MVVPTAACQAGLAASAVFSPDAIDRRVTSVSRCVTIRRSRRGS
ncbi:MAG TPA: hypothetical protein VH969_20010 [Actinophytocola sp.]